MTAARFYDPDGARYGMPTYHLELALPVRPMTPAKWAALAKAMQARHVCAECGLDRGYCIPTSLGMCPHCANEPVQLPPLAV